VGSFSQARQWEVLWEVGFPDCSRNWPDLREFEWAILRAEAAPTG